MRAATGQEIFSRQHADWRAQQQRTVEEALADDAKQVWVAAADGRVVGSVAAALHAERDMGEIGLLAVDAQHQNRGLGTALTLEATNWMVAEGMTLVMAETGGDPGHAPARRTYEKAGYTAMPIARYFKSLRSARRWRRLGPSSGRCGRPCCRSCRPTRRRWTRCRTSHSAVTVFDCFSPRALAGFYDSSSTRGSGPRTRLRALSCRPGQAIFRVSRFSTVNRLRRAGALPIQRSFTSTSASTTRTRSNSRAASGAIDPDGEVHADPAGHPFCLGIWRAPIPTASSYARD